MSWKKRREEVEAERRKDQYRRHDKRSFDKPARQWTCATFAIGTDSFRVLAHKPIADAEKAERCRNEAGLIRRQPREAANPCPAYAKAKEYQGTMQQEDAASSPRRLPAAISLCPSSVMTVECIL